MGNYKNEDYLKREIMEQSRHLFIYGYDNPCRSQFLQKFENEYPLIVDSKKPVALYFDSLGIEENPLSKDDDSSFIKAITREYLSFTIASKILERTTESDSINLEKRLSRLINLINKSRNNNHPEIKTIDKLLKEAKRSRDFYYENYNNYHKTLGKNLSIDDISLPVLPLEMFVNKYKRAMNIDSYFAIIYDKKNLISNSSTKAINSLINGRINKDISVKIVVEPDAWGTYKDSNNKLVERVHDYGTVELDDSYKQYIKTLKR